MKRMLFVALIAVMLLLFFGCVASSPVVERGPLSPEIDDINPEDTGDTAKNSDSAEAAEENQEPEKTGQETSEPETEPETELDPELESKQQPVPVTEQKPVFEYPDAVRGIYVTGNSAGGERLEKLIKLIDETDLNAMVIDVKDDYGNITFKLAGTPLEEYGKNYIKDPAALLERLAEHNIYPIARIVVFKDSTLAVKHPEYSFTQNGTVWRNGNGEAFVNPFIPAVWEHNLLVAKEAAKLGFQEIQFDYVRFPEGFEKREKYLTYSLGDYSEEKLLPRMMEEWEALRDRQKGETPPQYDSVQARVTAVTDFVKYAYQELEPFDVDVSVDIFGYSATVDTAPGIGQNFIKISENVDIISSMIYPSHWSVGYFGIPKPDKEPYRLVKEYLLAEKEKFALMASPPVSRPWIQDFTASWLGQGYYIKYGKDEVEAQIRALNEGGIKEFLIWNSKNRYTPGVDYTPEFEVQEEEQLEENSITDQEE